MGPRALRNFFKSFASDRRGNVAILFGLATIPIFGFVGVAIDYNRAADTRTAMQAAVDATALNLSREAAELSATDLEKRAMEYFKANFNRPEAKDVTVKPTLSTHGAARWSLKVVASAKVDTTILRALEKTGGFNVPAQLDVSASSEVNWGTRRLEIILALDNTGSMAASNKMQELKKASKSLLDTLKEAAQKNGDVKVGIVPFDTTVNMGTALKDLPIFDASCSALGNPSGCTPSTWKEYWDGCVRDRTWPYDTEVTLPTSTATLFPIFQCGSLVSLMPLTTNWDQLRNKIDSMTPNGMTNVTMGMVWAWMLLQNNPYTGAATPSSDLDKVVVLLTDGQNTEAWRNSNNTVITDVATIDARTELACQNAKATGVRIYTVRVIEGNADLLRKCASNPTMYYDVQNAGDLNIVFNSIAQSLASLYIAK